MRKKMKCLGRFRAFTVLELIVVVLIISGLAALALPRYHKTLLLARERDAVTQLRTLHEAITLYQMRTLHYLDGQINNVDILNQTFAVNIIPGKFQYLYQGADVLFLSEPGYMVTVTYAGTPSFVIVMGQKPITFNYAERSGADSFLFPWETESYASAGGGPPNFTVRNPCCSNQWGTNPCPSIPDCIY
jgi:type II secretory pathway pseudopilin PulG